MDSTFMGTLLCLHREALRRGGGRVALISPNPESHRLLRQMGLDQILPVVADEDEDIANARPMSARGRDIQVLQGNVVQAHEELAQLPGSIGRRFKAMAAGLAAEYAKRQASR
jgi:hypothetical protein